MSELLYKMSINLSSKFIAVYLEVANTILEPSNFLK